MSIEQLKHYINKFEILYVEDDPTVMAKVSTMFKEIFKSIHTASNGKEALEKYKEFYEKNQRNYDIVISDINMPIMNGAELSRELKQINPSQEIIIISAHNESDILQNLIDIGISNFIKKPIRFDSFVQAIIKVGDSLQFDKKKVEKLDEITKLNNEFEAILHGYDDLIIASRTDVDGVITYVSRYFEKISGFSKDELIGQTHRIVKHPDMPKKVFEHMWKTLLEGNIWKGKLKNLKKDGTHYWTKTIIAPYYNKDNKLLGYNSIREDITAQVRANELHKKVNMLLQHANDGYLLFDQKLVVESGYSKKCLEIFEKNSLENESITLLLFGNSEKKQKLFLKGINNIFSTNDEDAKEMFLSLLPKENTIDSKYLDIKYKLVDKKNIMVIIKDITEKIHLKSELEIKQLHQKMIIQIIANIHDYIDLKHDFEAFFKSIYTTNQSNAIELKNYSQKELLRQLHTFKGLFHQMQMVHTPTAIHELEAQVSNLQDSYMFTVNKVCDIRYNFAKDQEILEEMLGKDYFSEQLKLREQSNILTKFKYQLKDIVKNPVNINYKIQALISQIDLLSYINVYDSFEKHIPLVNYLAQTLEKQINTLHIKGDKNLNVPPTFKPFFRNLVHIYKNAVDHGVEHPDIRAQKNKALFADIQCNFYYKNNYIYISIGDDGSGIDIEKVLSKAIEKQIISREEAEKLTEDEKLFLIFQDELSTKDEANEISGRGVGMAALKDACESIGGTITIENKPDEGLNFHFKIPMKKLLNSAEASQHMQELISLIEAVANRIKIFFHDQMQIDIIDSRFIDETNISDKINTTIDIQSDVNYTTLCFSYSQKILERFTKLYFPDLLNDPVEFENSIGEISKEIINTLTGLAIQDFPARYLDGMLSTPQTITQEELQQLQMNNNEALTILIQTNFGNMVCTLIQRR